MTKGFALNRVKINENLKWRRILKSFEEMEPEERNYSFSLGLLIRLLMT